MFNSVLGTVTGQLDKRFLLNAFFPVGVALLTLAAVILTAFSSISSAADWWSAQQSVIQAVVAIGSVGLTFVLANALANNMLWITRLFEGYVIRGRIGLWGCRYQLAQFGAASEEQQRTDYPLNREAVAPMNPVPPTVDTIRPTRLGNILRNGETYPTDRYGVDAVRAWPRLYHLIPADMQSSMGDARASMETGLAVSFLAAPVGVVGSVLLLVTCASAIWVLSVLWIGLIVALLAYQSALPAARIYRDHVRAAFDLHRLELLSQMQMPMPVSADEERLMWDRVERFVGAGEPHGQRYVRPA
jgi:hypothetical protein